MYRDSCASFGKTESIETRVRSRSRVDCMGIVAEAVVHPRWIGYVR
jgi:hypothetical protein